MVTKTVRRFCSWLAPSLLALLLLHAAPARAVPRIREPVTDLALVLSPHERASLAELLLEHRRRTGVQMAILVVNSTDGEPIEDYSLQVAEAWGGGTRGRDDGVLLVLAAQDRRVRLEVGYGLEAAIPDARAKELLARARPQFRSGQYAEGLRAVVDGVVRDTEKLRPGQGVPWSVRGAVLLRRLTPGYVRVFLLALALALALTSRRWLLERGLRRVRRRERIVAVLSGPWATRVLHVVFWGGGLAMLAVHEPIEICNIALYVCGGLAGVYIGVSLDMPGRRARRYSILASVLIAAAILALAIGCLGGDPAKHGNQANFLSLVVLLAFVFLVPGMLAALAIRQTPSSSGSSDSSTSSWTSSSSWSSSDSSSSSSSSSSSDYSGGGGSFGGGGASDSF